MQISSTPSQFVKRCQQDCTRVGSLTLIYKNSNLDIIELATLRLWSCLFTRNLDQNEKSRVFFTSGQKKINCFIMDAYCDHCKTVFEAMGCYYHFCSCQIARPSSTDQDIEQGNKKREVDELRREHIQEKGYKVEEMWEYGLWEKLKTNDKIKNHVRTLFPYKRLPIYRLPFGKKKDRTLFGYV